ncbi:MAG: AraC family transcriptional regulator [Gammaproteobacteria bacterium]|nr:AraC family transcriptional regulator [Gammaproteobacteria bacterium]
MSQNQHVLEEIFRCICLQSCIYFARDFHAPWGMRIGQGDGEAQSRPGSFGKAQFHAVVAGQCTLTLGASTVELFQDDIVLLPATRTLGAVPHRIANPAHAQAAEGAEVLASLSSETPLFASGDTATKLMCGHYEYRTDCLHPFVEQLPAAIVLTRHAEQDLPSRRATIALLATECDRSDVSEAVVSRLAEVLLIDTLRAYVAQSDTPQFLVGLDDRRIARAVSTIHTHYSATLTLDDLASAAAMSRSAFADTFRSATGVAPIEYLTKWRMLNALELLGTGTLTVGQVAGRVGYVSESAFSRAFKRQMGAPPSEYRAR